MASHGGEVSQVGGPQDLLTEDQIGNLVQDALGALPLEGRSVCVLVPDATRTCPLPGLLAALHRALHGRVGRLSVIVALGTHQPMAEEALAAHLGFRPGRLEERYPGLTVRNHEWWDPATLVTVGRIPAARVGQLSEGRLAADVTVRVNRAVVEHDTTLIVGPVFPHEVVGFSGGNKYLFPGVSGPEMIDVSHWLGALITSAGIIGTPGRTPVRALIDEAASMLPGRRLALCVVTAAGGGLHFAAVGRPEDAWSAAVEVSARTHIRYLDSPVERVLSVLPTRYADLWTGAKGFYKVEPVVSDGGQVVIYAPHLSEISVTHPGMEEIGYHCRDYFLKQWERYRDLPWGELAHSTHLRGAGTYDTDRGEKPRVVVTLATAIPEEVVRAVNLDYLDPAGIDVQEWSARPSTLVVHEAGEDLYRLRG